MKNSKKEAATLEFQKVSSVRDSELLNNQIIMMRKTRDSTRLDYEKEMERLRHLQQESVKQEGIVNILKTVMKRIISKSEKPLKENCIVFCQTEML